MEKNEKREFYKGLNERIKQLRMQHLFEEPCPFMNQSGKRIITGIVD